MKIEVSGLCRAFGDLEVLRDFSMTAETGKPVAVTGPSGSGKTTLVRILLGLETADGGELRIPSGTRFAAAFQDDRLLEGFSAVENVRLATGIRDRARIRGELRELLPEDALDKPVRLLSGGQRRRVAVVRACMAESDVLLLDEPFAGLDARSAERTAGYIRERGAEKIVILAVHTKDVPDHCARISLRGGETGDG